MIRQRDAPGEGLAGDTDAGVAAVGPADADDVDLVLEVGVTESALEFDVTELRIGAGQQVRIVFNNTDHMEHNLVVITPGSIADIGRLADELALSPEGRAQNYVPDSPDVLASTPVVGAWGAYELTFTAPEEPGEYPFVCTIPGHWRSMRGALFGQVLPFGLQGAGEAVDALAAPGELFRRQPLFPFRPPRALQQSGDGGEGAVGGDDVAGVLLADLPECDDLKRGPIGGERPGQDVTCASGEKCLIAAVPGELLVGAFSRSATEGCGGGVHVRPSYL
jgi:azurin